MGAKLTLRYDRVGDILHIDKRSPYPEQESDELDNEVVARTNPKTGEIENIEILFFTARLFRGAPIELPVSATMHSEE